MAAALQGSSFYKLPRVLQWFSGNIGFHHIHHLSPRIPNYNLEKCHQADPLFQTVKPITLFPSLRSFTFRLWDEKRRKLVGYGHLRKYRHQHGLPNPPGLNRTIHRKKHCSHPGPLPPRRRPRCRGIASLQVTLSTAEEASPLSRGRGKG